MPDSIVNRRRNEQAHPAKRVRATISVPAILTAAKRLFLEFGYDGVNLERVGEAAGVSRQTVYNRFGSKEAVFRAMVEAHWSAIRNDDVFSAGDMASEPETLLRCFGEAILAFVADADQIAFTRLVIAESRRLPWIAEEFYRLGKQPLLLGFANCLKQLDARGLLDCKAPEFATHQFMGLIQEFVIWPRVMAIGSEAQPRDPPEHVVEEAIAMFMARYRPVPQNPSI